ncbi:MAG: caspase family protein [Proteobacteria bacterium]|nr:caspase family protein [Pseudomonadota bacterium]MBU4296605.1 caspase family protein [Pseudomonadota bacterium]MCG2748234.1 caspase family protein [Desulfobulbaceae bacterium]
MTKRAVLIGINRYRIPGADLRGCVNDVKNMQGVLTRDYGFKAGDIAVLTDFAATKKAMQAAIRNLVSKGRAGDVLLVHYSGHGANVPDDDGDEADNRDEILCPTNLDWKDPLRDDWLRATFDKLRVGVSLTVIMDCCHSGTNTRALLPPDAPMIPRYLPNPWDMMAEESGRKLRGKLRSELRASPRARRRKSDVVEADIPELLITGCRDTQTSADAYICDSYNGALTYHLVAALTEAKGEISYRDLHRKTLANLKQGDYDQAPQLEGRKEQFDRMFLSPLP